MESKRNASSSQAYTGYGRRQTPQTEPIPGSSQVKNSAGGYSYAIDDMERFRRFLILGSSSNTLYASAREMTKENLVSLERLLSSGRGKEVVDLIVEISDAGRGVSNDPALFALARCCACDVHGKVSYMRPEHGYMLHRTHHHDLLEQFPEEGETKSLYAGKAVRHGDTLFYTVPKATSSVLVDHPDDVEVKRYAYAALQKVARTGTHLFHFMKYVKQFRGRGHIHQRALKSWYNDMDAAKLALQVVKYQQRDGWAQRDVLRLTRPKPSSEAHNAVYHWVTKGWEENTSVPSEEGLGLIWAFEKAKHSTDPNEIVDLICLHRLPREAVPTQNLKSVKVWEALLQAMPIEAMVRNLATMTKNEVLVPMGEMTRLVCERLRSQEDIQKARLHPMKLLAALSTYQSGKSARGDATWVPIREVVDALNDAFYLAFKNVEPTDKRYVLGLDVSGSMTTYEINGIPGLTARVAAAAMALVTAATEPNYTIMAFGHQFVPLSISPRQRLDDVVRATSGLPFSGTDCALPMLWAMEHNIKADVFVVYTDNETWYGNIHPVQALQQYRQKMNIPAKLVVVGMASNGFSIASPEDSGMLDVVGFDTNTPTAIADFVSM